MPVAVQVDVVCASWAGEGLVGLYLENVGDALKIGRGSGLQVTASIYQFGMTCLSSWQWMEVNY